MKILLISTLKRAVTSQVTASRSQIISQLASGLVKRGHTVSLLGTQDSHIEGVETIGVLPQGWVDLPPAENEYFYQIATSLSLLEKLTHIQSQFDIIHNHFYPEFLPPIIEERLTTPFVTTLHTQPTEYIDDLTSMYKKTHFVSISKAHQAGYTKTHPKTVIYNGVDTHTFAFESQKDEYLLWIGRLSKAKNQDGSFQDPKGVKWAIDLAERTHQKLILTGSVEDKHFYEQEVLPHLSESIQWYGPVTSEQGLKREEIVSLYQKAKAFLMTINWEEPFGLVMAEAGSCGTPVIAFNRGAVSEIVVDSKTGFIIDPTEGVDGLAKGVEKLSTINPKDCRQHIEEHFTIERMVEGYESLYQTLKQ